MTLPEAERKNLVVIFLDTSSSTGYQIYRQLALPLFDGRLLSARGLRSDEDAVPESERRSLCFKKVYFGLTHFPMLTREISDTRIAIVEAYRQAFLTYYNLSRRPAAALDDPNRPLEITIINRFMTRRILNVPDLVNGIQKTLASGFSREVKISQVMFENRTVADQVKIIASSDVVVGMLGAATCGPITFLPERAILVQVIPERLWSNV